MREMVQQSTSGSTELAASSEQMSKMAHALMDTMDRFILEQNARRAAEFSEHKHGSRSMTAAAGANA